GRAVAGQVGDQDAPVEQHGEVGPHGAGRAEAVEEEDGGFALAAGAHVQRVHPGSLPYDGRAWPARRPSTMTVTIVGARVSHSGSGIRDNAPSSRMTSAASTSSRTSPAAFPRSSNASSASSSRWCWPL